MTQEYGIAIIWVSAKCSAFFSSLLLVLMCYYSVMVLFYLTRSNYDCLNRLCVNFLGSKLLVVQHRLSISKFACIRIRKILWVFIFNINMHRNIGTFLFFSRTWFMTISFPPRGCLTTTFRFLRTFFWNTKNKKNYTTEIWDIMLL